MQIAGVPRRFSDGLIPPDYVDEILNLVLIAWPKVRVPANASEPDISALLKDRLRDEMDDETILVPFIIHHEVQSSDPITGRQYKRTDIEFQCRDIFIPQTKPYFTFEAKCLRVIGKDDEIDANNAEYIKEMINFLKDIKKIAPSFCGMLGCVMDGDTNKAHASLQKSLVKKAAELGMPAPGMSKYSHFLHPPHGETDHVCSLRVSGKLPIYHLLLPV